MEHDNDLKKILDELNDNKGVESFNRKYFNKNEFQTPQNTPCAVNAPTSLKNLDFSKFMNNNYDYSDEENSPQKKELQYCDTTYLGKTGLKLGNDNSRPTICKEVLCTKCDVKVSSFKNKKWGDGCDYLFFRNNYGNDNKLKEKLISSSGCISYSCQCSWVTIEDEYKNVEEIPGVNWTCAGHLY